MPIFEFRCLGCSHIYEKLMVNSQDNVEFTCPECDCPSCERVVSKTNYAMGVGVGGNRPNIETKSCGSSNQCMTLNLPGHSKE